MKYLILAIAMLGVTMATNAQTNDDYYIVRITAGMTKFNQYSHSEAAPFQIKSFGVNIARSVFSYKNIDVYAGLGLEGRQNIHSSYSDHIVCGMGVIFTSKWNTYRELLLPLSLEVKYNNIWNNLGVSIRPNYNIRLADVTYLEGVITDFDHWGLLNDIDEFAHHSTEVYTGVFWTFKQVEASVSYRLINSYKKRHSEEEPLNSDNPLRLVTSVGFRF